MGAAFQYSEQLELMCHCCVCGVPIVVPNIINTKRRENGASFWCVNGHPQSFTESEVANLRQQLEREKKAHSWTKQGLEKERNSNAGLRGEITKVKNRVGNGVCPCCNRSFSNVRRHMDTMHPEYKKDA